jgi:glycosyltransferase involved in cell wall biosynthesis
MVVISEAVWGCYPFIESIKSFLPVVDEMVIAFNVYGKKDGTLEKLKELQTADKRIRIVPTVFDIFKYGWVSYGIARTMGYQACHGDVVLMFDCDGVLHENQVDLLKRELHAFITEGCATGYWEKHRIYKPEVYYPQHKHSGIYSKEILGDRLDFMRDDGKGAPNFTQLTPKEQASKKFTTTLFGYEHVWDTEEVLKFKVNRYGVMLDTLNGKPIQSPDEYFKTYMNELVHKVNKESKHMAIANHPSSMHNKLREVNASHFGYDFFGFK